MAIELDLNGYVVSGRISNGDSSGRTVDVVRHKQRPSGGGWEPQEPVASGILLPGLSSVEFTDRLDSGGVYEYRAQLTDDPTQATTWFPVRLEFPLHMAQNAPNPFVVGTGLDTAIRYTIGGFPQGQATETPIESYNEVLLEIYDVRGARIATLFDGILPPDEYEVHWNGLDHKGNPAASGVYFYRLTAGGVSLTRKMVVIRR
jgi:hypothetical protein